MVAGDALGAVVGVRHDDAVLPRGARHRRVLAELPLDGRVVARLQRHRRQARDRGLVRVPAGRGRGGVGDGDVEGHVGTVAVWLRVGAKLGDVHGRRRLRLPLGKGRRGDGGGS